MQISGIKNAGLNVSPHNRYTVTGVKVARNHKPMRRSNLVGLFLYYTVFSFSGTIILLHLLSVPLALFGQAPSASEVASSISQIETGINISQQSVPEVKALQVSKSSIDLQNKSNSNLPKQTKTAVNSRAGQAPSSPATVAPPVQSVQKAATASPHPTNTLLQPQGKESSWAKANGKLTLRNEPKSTSPEIAKVTTGGWLPVVSQQDGWVKLKLGQTQTGWAQTSEVAIDTLAQDSQLVTIQSGTAIFQGPDQSFPSAPLKTTASFTPVQVSGGWVQLQQSNGNLSWVQASSIQWGYGHLSSAAPVSNTATTVSLKTNTVKPGLLSGKTIIVDAGHGGQDSGARGKSKDVYERDVNLSAAIALQHKLEAAGANVIMTRESNDIFVSLPKRVEVSNTNKADMFVSIHQNMVDDKPSVRGTITFYSNEADKKLAAKIEDSIVKIFGSKQNVEGVRQEGYYVLRKNERPAVLVEGCFLSNPAELTASLTTSFHDKLASGIYNGILSYWNINPAQSGSES